ncbi:uncharacterized protein BJ171DRAFT_502902 [Polychytrium aggregatum]|uniref:uncharacterized protein n=1 Tax=Polychytrium aggregatum TaxID=110093 RepID=UPI0022FEF7C8|nr:uncharacterized protein BJ171DRAFT_502902 [Polychytrium aggregatum]KAI9205073.1 hypothetical protein BJ171DRAFT_502902 [Polychytrium aggregatum]
MSTPQPPGPSPSAPLPMTPDLNRILPNADRSSLDQLFSLGEYYLKNKQYSDATKVLTLAAKNNHLPAQMALARIYSKGLGTAQSYSNALEWYKRAAESDDPVAEFNVGYFYANGYGIEKDMAKAILWYRLSIRHGFANAQFHLAMALQIDTSDSKALEESFSLMAQAAAAGFPDAQYQLARMYAKGMGCARSSTKALAILKRLPESSKILFLTGYIYFTTPALKKQTEALKLWSRAAAEGDGMSAHNVGHCYQWGLAGLELDYNEAMYWYTRAENMGFKESQIGIYECWYWLEEYDKVYEKLEQALKDGFTSAHAYLGHCFFFGHGVKQDYDQAVLHYVQVPEEYRDVSIHLQLGRCYLEGLGGIERNLDAAYILIQMGTLETYPTSLYYRGYCLENGFGCTKNLEEAIEWYIKGFKAKDKDSQEALLRLGRLHDPTTYVAYHMSIDPGLINDELCFDD